MECLRVTTAKLSQHSGGGLALGHPPSLPYNGRSFEHRRAWVEQRLLELVEIFAVGVYAYAVMSNHVHVVLRIDPTAAATWSDEEVALRWVRLFPATADGEIDAAACRLKERTLLGNPGRLSACRQHLGSLAWFMKALNEPIARRANREDACTGRFWEGRYKCQKRGRWRAHSGGVRCNEGLGARSLLPAWLRRTQRTLSA